jgi:hypothetical protein
MSCWFTWSAARYRGAPTARTAEAIGVLSRLAYLTLCRSMEALVLLVRGDATKDLEILVLRHQLTVLRRQPPRLKLEPADRALLAAISRALPPARWVMLPREAGDTTALASAAGRRRVDLPARTRAAAAR